MDTNKLAMIIPRYTQNKALFPRNHRGKSTFRGLTLENPQNIDSLYNHPNRVIRQLLLEVLESALFFDKSKNQ